MNKPNELTVSISVKTNIERKTAEACLKIVELYVNQTGCDVIAHRHEDGTLSFEFTEGR